MINVRYYPLQKPLPDSNPEILFCGLASVNTEDLGLNGIKVKYSLEKKGYFIEFPGYRGSDGKWRNHFLTISKNGREQLTKVIIAAVKRHLQKKKATS